MTSDRCYGTAVDGLLTHSTGLEADPVAMTGDVLAGGKFSAHDFMMDQFMGEILQFV